MFQKFTRGERGIPTSWSRLGWLSRDLTGNLGATSLLAGIEDQAREVLAQLEATLLRAGSAKSRLLMCTIYLADMADRAAFNQLWDPWLESGTAPVRACVQVGLAEPDYKLEIHAVAATA